MPIQGRCINRYGPRHLIWKIFRSMADILLLKFYFYKFYAWPHSANSTVLFNYKERKTTKGFIHGYLSASILRTVIKIVWKLDIKRKKNSKEKKNSKPSYLPLVFRFASLPFSFSKVYRQKLHWRQIA